MSTYDAYEARKAAEAMNDTWGHLRPKKDTAYTGYILYCVGECGDITCIESNFEGLPGSPWFHDDLHDFIGGNGEERGRIYYWHGTYNPSWATKFTGKLTSRNAGFVRTELFGG